MFKRLQLFAFIFTLVLALPAAAQVPSYVPTDGIEGWWSFNGNANDESDNQNQGTTNNLTFGNDRFGNTNGAISLDGIGNNSILSLPFFEGSQVSSFTLHAVVNYNAPNNGMCIWGKTLFWGEVNFSITNTNGISCYWANTVTGNRYSSMASESQILSPNTWYTIDIVFQNSTAQIFLNGLPIMTELTWSNQGGSLVSNNQIEETCNFASDENSSRFGEFAGTTYFNGLIDEFGIWNSALSPELIADMSSGESINPSTPCTSLPSNLQQGLVGYWPFCGNASDESGNGNDGEVNGATMTEDRFGNSDKAYAFDGISQNIILQDFTNSIPDTSITISIWAMADTNKIQVPLSSVSGFDNSRITVHINWEEPDNDIWSNTIWDFGTSTLFAGRLDCQIDEATTHEWHHYVFVADALSNYTGIYMDGQIRCEGENSNIGYFNSILEDVVIGGTGIGFFDGSLDDIGIWNRALTPEEVQELYTLEACTFTVYDTLTVYETVYDTVYTYETIYDTVTTYVTVTDTLLIDITFTGVEGQPSWLNTVTVFPNPASDYITIDYGNFTLMAGFNTIITNAAGATVHQGLVNSQQTTIDINAWGSTGVYYMSIYDANGELVAVRHIVLQ